MGNSCKTTETKDKKPKVHFKPNNITNKPNNTNITNTTNQMNIQPKITNTTNQINIQPKITNTNFNTNIPQPKNVTWIEKKENIPEKIEENTKKIINNDIINVKKVEPKIEIIKKDEPKIEKNKKEENKNLIVEQKKPKEIIAEVDDVNNFDNSIFNIKIQISLKKFKEQGQYKVVLYEYQNGKKLTKNKIGETESKSPDFSNNINFETETIIPFHFSQIQPLEFVIMKDLKQQTVVSKIVGDILGGVHQTLKVELTNDSSIEISAILNEKLTKECSFDVSLNGSFVGMKLVYTISSLGNIYSPINKLLYESEILEGINKSNFKNIVIPLSELAMDDNLNDNLLEINFKDASHSNELGKCSNPISQFLKKEMILDLKGERKATIICRKKNFNSFIDYLAKSVRLNVIISIDFSKQEENNFHSMEFGTTNFGEILDNFASILSPYVEDKLFYVYGYGFKFNGQEKSNADLKMYPINHKPESEYIKKEEIVKNYLSFLEDIKFDESDGGISYIINKNNLKIKKDVEDYEVTEYNLLLLFTFSDIPEKNSLINDIILCSSLPISIVIVGLGDNPFTNLIILSNNYMYLKGDNNSKPKRECFKFISYNSCSKNIQKTIKDSLNDIPNELIEFFDNFNFEN